MPIYEYICEDCQTHFERIVGKTIAANGDHIVCPKCGSERKNLQFSVFSSPRGSSGGDESSSSSRTESASGGCGCTPSSCGCH
jgi:putative FmdB family regulatory protein